MNKDLGQQIVHQKVQKGHINYVAHLIKRFAFTKLVECLWQ